ncbi:DUF302 domain-containing protein [Sedimenticola thiotaurini]|uniref:Membrane protein n=1 Tax=Sedimenticola thiotaurini TaxID=1543721 RepID=A0A0F7JZC6_9GAMM|nr:DUF302 domain-containing protein [Sedimenticola thiotaurini]AKH20013.1 membrane protein [Sedimenticola thiotaurini]
MKKVLFAAFAFIWLSAPLSAADGVINVASEFGVEETANRLEAILTKKGMTVFNRIKHSDGAAKVGIELRKTELIIFGNPKVGSPLMACQQSVAIDLPQKALIWEDGDAKVWISYNDPRYLEQRHSIVGCQETLQKVEKALAGMTRAAATR